MFQEDSGSELEENPPEEIESPPQLDFPVCIFQHLQRKHEFSFAAFPRIESWVTKAHMANGRVAGTESLLFSLIQELLLTQNVQLGGVILDIAKDLPDYYIDYDTWLQFIIEYAFTAPDLLVFPLGIVRPHLFRQEQGDFPRSDLFSILASSLFCRNVTNSPHCRFIISAIKYIIESGEPARMTPAFGAALEVADPQALIDFECLFPVIPATYAFLVEVCSNVIAHYLGEAVDTELNFEMKSQMRKISGNADPYSENILAAIFTMLTKWVIVRVKLESINDEMFTRIRGELDFEINQPFGEAMFLKERLKVAQSYVESVFDYYKHVSN